MKSDNENPIVLTAHAQQRAKWRDRHPKLNEILISAGGPLLGAIPGGFMLWMVTGPILHSKKLSPSEIMELAFIAGGILWVGVFLGAIMAGLTMISQKLSAMDARLSSGSSSIPPTTSIKKD